MANRLVVGAVGSLAVKVVATGLAFGVTVAIARFLQPAEFGVYSFVLSIVTILTIIAQTGLPTLLVRETAKAETLERWPLMAGLWQWAGRVTLLASVLLALTAAFSAVFLARRVDLLEPSVLNWGLILVPIIALMRIKEAATRGLRHVVIGQLGDAVTRPALLLALVLASPALTLARGATEVMQMHVIAGAFALLLSVAALNRVAPRNAKKSDRLEREPREWLTSAVPLAFVAGMGLIIAQTDVFMMGLFRSAEEVGIYRVAAQGSMLISFALPAIAMMATPYFARFHAQGDLDEFQRLATNGSRAMMLFAFPVAFILVVFGEPIIEFVFGSSFAEAAGPLAVLAAAQLIHTAFGILGPLLAMTGNERQAARGIAIAAVVNVSLNLLLIPEFGMYGAASASAITYVVWNTVLWIAVRRVLGVDSSVLGLRRAPVEADR